MVSSTDILEFSLESLYQSPSNRGLNVFQYEVDVASPFVLATYGAELIQEWYNYITAIIQPITSDAVAWREVAVRNLSDPDEIYIGIPEDTSAGAVAGDCMPPYVSWGFLLRRTTAATRNGYKRFWGVPESLQEDGVPTTAAALLLPGIATSLANGFDLEVAGTPAINPQFYPVIVRKDNTGALVASQRVASGQFRSIGTQNTRKFGRGM